MRFSQKITLLLVFAALCLASCAISLSKLSEQKEKNLEQKYSLISDSVYESVENELGKPLCAALSMANNSFLRAFLLKEAKLDEVDFNAQTIDYLSALKDTIGAQTAFLVSDQSRRYYTFSGFNKTVNPESDFHDVWYSAFINSRKKYDIDVDIDQAHDNLWTVFINARINDENGKFLGVCGVGLSMEKLQGILKQYENKNSVKVNFINSEGIIQVDTDTINIENSYLYDTQYGKEKDGYSYKNKDGEYVVMRYVENLNWYLVIHGDGDTLEWGDVLPISAITALLMLLDFTAIIVEVKKSKKTVQ